MEPVQRKGRAHKHREEQHPEERWTSLESSRVYQKVAFVGRGGIMAATAGMRWQLVAITQSHLRHARWVEECALGRAGGLGTGVKQVVA